MITVLMGQLPSSVLLRPRNRAVRALLASGARLMISKRIEVIADDEDEMQVSLLPLKLGLLS